MAIKQRVLDKLTAINNELPGALQAGAKGTLATMHKAMAEARDLCQKGLPESRYTDYGEFFDGILLAIAQLSEGQVNPAKAEMLSLSQDLLQALINKIQTEGDFKKEIVFLPYKSSMWDSLESVWRAANDDKAHCIAYVVAIPYCDRNPDGSPREWHCEKNMFPKDVPVLDWQSIDLAAMHPDVIFIHNPYDQNNIVTSVDSHYYSSTLKDQTEKLVYIPYFVLGEPELDDKTDEEIEKIEENIEHFVTVPAVLNAHQVIVQSEAMRRVYIDVLLRRTNVKDWAFWEKRILGLGSPKFDKLATTKKEELDIPEEWRRVIQKPDGTWKKIIFYNTGLTALLQHNEKMLAKMRQVFQTFKEHKDEVALLWRPHPLIPATIYSMRPQLADDYEDIVKNYKQEGWGIYDDSDDVDRAIIVSDAYYGDGSSVIQLYKATGKMIMMQGVETES